MRGESPFLLYYFVLVLALGLAYAPWVLASYGIFPQDLAPISVVVGGLSPALAAILLTYIKHGRGGVRSLFSQFLVGGFPRLWFLAAVVIPAIISACALLLTLIFQPALLGAYALNRGGLFAFFPVLLLSFAMNMWEEIGWRGYALPRL